MNAENCEKLAAETSPNSAAQEFEWMTHMRKITFWSAIAAAALMLVGTAGWVKSNNRGLEAQASAQIEDVRIDPFQIMLNAKNLPSEEFDVAP